MDKIIAETKNEFYDKIKESGYDIIDDDGKWLILDDGESTYEAEYTRYSDGSYELMLYNINKVEDKNLIVESYHTVTSDDVFEGSRFENDEGKVFEILEVDNDVSTPDGSPYVLYKFDGELPRDTTVDGICAIINHNNYKRINSSRKITSARYIATDPESGEVLGSADTYKEAVNEWGEDVIITDSEVAENVTSSYEFNRNIVNSVLSQKMTEQEAIQKIASRKDVNIGFARQIFNNLINDKSLISSGTMEMANKINQEFDLNGDLYSWFKDYVGNEGKASTIGGELVRAANQIISEYQENGDGIGYGRGRETVNPAARFIIKTCDDYSESRNMSDMLDETDDINYGIWIETFEKTFTDYLRDHEELFHQVNQDNFWDYAETGDKITSVDEFCTYDEDGNEYWFTRDENDDWICTEIEYEEKPLFKVNDAISETDNVAGKIDKTEPYGTFEENGFIYSYEADVDDEQGEYDHWIVTDIDRNDLKYHVDDKLNGNDFEYEDIFDENGNEITYRDLF